MSVAAHINNEVQHQHDVSLANVEKRSRRTALRKHAGTSRRYAKIVPTDSITILRVTYPVHLHTVLSWSNGQMVNTYGKMQKWQSQVHRNRLFIAMNSCIMDIAHPLFKAAINNWLFLLHIELITVTLQPNIKKV
ncbi:hypothetical protein Tsp_15849 [Trichinella spiralis]|uniref:hypothetical protein n=1 Tax=Trichinella spiralis TaxID=6334 RepID=UPI0001EFD4C7|nr:hypothetical protein Tsp_15849 [Trichinella spiralis]